MRVNKDRLIVTAIGLVLFLFLLSRCAPISDMVMFVVRTEASTKEKREKSRAWSKLSAETDRLYFQNQLEEAERAGKNALEFANEEFGPFSGDKAYAMQSLFSVYEKKGDIDQADQIIKDAIPIVQELIKNPSAAKTLDIHMWARDMATFMDAIHDRPDKDMTKLQELESVWKQLEDLQPKNPNGYPSAMPNYLRDTIETLPFLGVLAASRLAWGSGGDALCVADLTSRRPSTQEKLDAILKHLDAYEKVLDSSVWRFEMLDADGDYDRSVTTIIRDQKNAQSAYEEIRWRGDKIGYNKFFVDRGEVFFSGDRILGEAQPDVNSSAYPQNTQGNYFFGPIGGPGESFRSRIGRASHYSLFESVTTPSLLILASRGVISVFDEARGYYPVFQGVYFVDHSDGKFFETIEAKDLVKLSNGYWWPKSWTLSSGKLAEPSGAWEKTRERNYNNLEIELAADQDALKKRIEAFAPLQK